MAPIIAPTVKLNNGYEMPVLGLGTYELQKNKCEHALRAAIDIGYRHIDTAYLYRNEEQIGKVLKEKMAAGVVQRSDLFVVTKLWNIFHEPSKVEYACRKQLKSLQMDYVDLYLMHSPIGYKYVDDDNLMPHEHDVLQTNDIDYVDTYKAMEALVGLGLVRSIGLSNFNSEQVKRIMESCTIKPVTNQVECHPGLNQKPLIEFCRSFGIVVTAYSPLARLKATKPTPPFYLSSEMAAIAKQYKKTVIQVVLRYLIDIGTVPIPKSQHAEHLLENMEIFDFSLTETEITKIDGSNIGKRLWTNESANQHKYWPFAIEF